MQSFVSRHQYQIQGSLSGFDRVRFVGSLLRLSYVDGLAGFLAVTGVLLKEFGDSMSGLSRRIKQASERLAETTASGRVHYLPSGSPRKEDFARLARPGSTLRPDRRPQLRRALPVLRPASQPTDQAPGTAPRRPQ